MVQQKIEEALGEAKMSATLSNKENEMLDKAHNVLILSLWDKVLREVSKERLLLRFGAFWKVDVESVKE